MTLEQALRIAIGYLRAGITPSLEQIEDLDDVLKAVSVKCKYIGLMPRDIEKPGGVVRIQKWEKIRKLKGIKQ